MKKGLETKPDLSEKNHQINNPMQNYKNKIEAIKIILQQHLLAAERTIESCETDAAEFFAKGRKEECEFILDFLQDEEVLDVVSDTLAEALVEIKGKRPTVEDIKINNH